MLPASPFVVIVGPSGAGKSTLCRRVIDAARQNGLAVGGFVTEKRLRDGVVAGLDVVDVASGDRLPLAEFDLPTGGPTTGRWHFHRTAFDAGLEWCRRAAPDTTLLADELGPLELVQHLGWAPAIPVLRTHPGPLMVVVRPSLVDACVAALGRAVVTVVSVSSETRELALADALAALRLRA